MAFNPFAKSNPFAKKETSTGDLAPAVNTPVVKEEIKPVVEQKVEVKEIKKEEIKTPMLERENPFRLNKADQAEKPAEEVKIETVKAEDKVVDINTAKSSKVEEKTEEIKNDEVQKVEEPKKNESEKENIKTEEATPPPIAKPKAKRKPAVSKAKADTTVGVSVEFVEGEVLETPVRIAVDIPTTSLSYEDAMVKIQPLFVSKDWQAVRESTSKELGEVIISHEMTGAGIRVAIDKLDSIRQSVWQITADTKTLFENLTIKEPAGLIERVKIAGSVGANTEERKQAGLRATVQYIKDGETINLLELLDETRSRNNYLAGLNDSIKYKTNVLITMLGALKH